jgi:putative ABC transport system permease protein
VLRAVDDAMNGALGFDRREVLTATLTLPPRAYATPDQRRQFVAAVSERMAARPAVRTVAVVSHLPYAEAGRRRPLIPEGPASPAVEVRSAAERLITPDYFAALRIAAVAGRGLHGGDTTGAPLVALVSAGLAAEFWPGRDPIGRRFRQAADGPWIEVVGVVADVRHDWLFNTRNATVYRPYAQDPTATLSFVVRTQGDPADLAGDLRRAVGAVDPDQPLLAVRTMQTVIDDRSGGIRYLSRALAAMSGIAFVLAVTGIYALVSYLTARRTREIGVRMALGATPGDVVRLATRQTAGLGALGLIGGVALALAAMRAMEAALFGLIAPSPWVLAGATAILATAVLLAGYLPARRAAGLDPTVALRTE